MTKNKAKLTIHPAADIFPMLDEVQLAGLAQSIATNGQRFPIMLWRNGKDEDILIDGRNRDAACALVEIEPKFAYFEGDEDDVIAYIADVNLERRDLTKAQKVMALAKLYPEPQEGFKKKDDAVIKKLNSVAKSLNSAKVRLSLARQILPYDDLAQAVLSGVMGLEQAHNDAKKRKFKSESEADQMAELQAKAPDLWELVPEKLSLEEALAALEKREETEAAKLESSIRASCDVVKGAASHVYSLAQPHCQESTRALYSNEEFIARASKAMMWDLMDETKFQPGLDFLMEVIHTLKSAKEKTKDG